VLSEKQFVKTFGPPTPNGKGKGTRCSVFGAEDELKVAPKMPGVDKNHKDIDLLKLRSLVVVKRFSDKEVLDENFVHNIASVMAIMTPLVQLLNEMIRPTPRDDSDDDESEHHPDEAEAAEGDEGIAGDEPDEEDNDTDADLRGIEAV